MVISTDTTSTALRAPAPGRLQFVVAITLSAMLLFSVQPMFAKMVLPVLGGAPAVWAVSMAFFQVLLLAGYVYAHALDRWLAPRMALVVHLVLTVVAAAALPIALPSGAAALAGSGSYTGLLAVLAIGVGLPFFALSANAPLIQSWYARTAGAVAARNPYALYVASNAGSLVALAAYPFVIEPLTSLGMQSRAWSVGYLALIVALAWAGASLMRSGAAIRPTPDMVEPATPATRTQRLGWIALALIPSGLLVAFTTFVTTDLGAVPLFWVAPLAAYLATFVVTFRDRPLFGWSALLWLLPASTAVLIATMDWNASFAWALAAVSASVATLSAMLVCHRLLYERRPEPARLTEFYALMSTGGALGGLSAALAAPHVFANVLELPVLLAAACLVAAALTGRSDAGPRPILHMAVAAVGGIALLLAADQVVARLVPGAWTPERRALMLGALAAYFVMVSRRPRPAAALLSAAITGLALLPNGSSVLHVTRSFFGTHKVVATPGTPFHLLMHGTTLHGAQVAPGPGRMERPVPLTYYHPKGPLARGVGLARAASPGRPLRAGIIGLGSGAMACHAAPGERWRFYEIDPEVARIATTPRLFTYLAACQPTLPDIVLGDARLTLAREADGAFDYLVIDAFSSDAIPVHLMTVEALRLALAKLSPAGILALHISNQNLDLAPVVAANVAAHGGLAAVFVQGEGGGGAIRSQVVLIARGADLLAPAMTWPNARALTPTGAAAWTDDFSNVLSALVRRMRIRLAGGE